MFRPWYSRRWLPLLAVPLIWAAFVLLTGVAYADNVRYFRTIGGIAIYSTIVLVGSIGSLVCLVFAIPRWWWHILALPLWFIFLTEIFVLFVHALRFATLAS